MENFFEPIIKYPWVWVWVIGYWLFIWLNVRNIHSAKTASDFFIANHMATGLVVSGSGYDVVPRLSHGIVHGT